MTLDPATLAELRTLADEHRVARTAEQAALDRRDAAITAAFAVGVSPTRMARAIGLDRQLVYRIAKRDQHA